VHKLSLLAAIGLSAALAAQNCSSSGAGTPVDLSTNNPTFTSGFVLGNTNFPAIPPTTYIGYSQVLNVTCAVPVSVNRIDVNLLDDGGLVGLGGGATFAMPIMTGYKTTVDVYLGAGPYLAADHQNAGAPPAPGVNGWVAGPFTGILTISGANTHSQIVFPSPFSLSAGQTKMHIQVKPVEVTPTHPLLVGLGLNQPNASNVAPNLSGSCHPLFLGGTIVNPVVASDSIMQISDHALQRDSWGSGILTPLADLNIAINYTPGAGSASFSPYGVGCVFDPLSFYEVFPQATTRDLGNSCVQMTYNSATPNYSVQVLPGAGTAFYVPPTTPALALAGTDDANQSTVVTLPWNFPYMNGRSGNSLWMGTNGKIDINLANTNAAAPYAASATPSVTTLFLNRAYARIAPYYTDLDLSFSGTMYSEVDPSNPNQWNLTWLNVEEYRDSNYTGPYNPATPKMTFQVQLSSNGDIKFVYTTPLIGAEPNNYAIVGFSNGNNDNDPGNRDFTALSPFNTGIGRRPPVLTMTARPVIGQSLTMTTNNMDPLTAANVFVLGFASTPGGFDLGLLGLGITPNCRYYIAGGTANFLIVNLGGTTSSQSIFIPPVAAYNGTVMQAQSAQIMPIPGMVNPAGITVSNAVCMAVGLF